MRYEEYEKKIIRRAKVLKVLYRFRLAIILTVSAALLVSGSLIGTKGLVKEEETLAVSYHYGDELSYRSSAFLSNVSYEFSPFDVEEWSPEAPYLVGKYKMRSKGENSFSSYYYGQEQAFEILPKEVTATVAEDSLTYGELPTLKLEGLCYGDHFEETYTMSYSDKTEPKWTISPDHDSILIRSSSGADVTSNYAITIAPKELNILKKSLQISTGSANKTYDGTALKSEEFHIVSGSLVAGDSIELVDASSITNAGRKDNAQSFRITTGDGSDMTSHYDISLVPGNLTISKRPLSLATSDYEFTYDGTDKKNFMESMHLQGEDKPAEGEEVHCSYADQAPYVDAGEYVHAFQVKVVRGETDVTENYAITKNPGKTIIQKRALVLTSGSRTFDYDKEKRSVNEANIAEGYSLAEKDEFVVTSYPEPIDAGEYQNALQFSLLDKGTHADVAKNYEVTFNTGKITINPIALKVRVKPLTVTYDGKPHKNDFELIEGELVGEDTLVESVNPEQTNVGTYDNPDFDVVVKDEKGLDNTKNYVLSYEGKEECLTIQKRTLKIDVKSKEKTYDAKPMSASMAEDEVYYEVLEGTFAEKEYGVMTYVDEPPVVKAGKHPITRSFVIYHQLGEEKDPAKDSVVTSNYDLSYQEGKWDINKRAITLKTLDVERAYDRTSSIPADKKAYELVEDAGDGLVEGHHIETVGISCAGVNVGVYPYVIDESKLQILDEKNEDVTENYAVTYINNGKMTIVKRDTEVTLSDAKKTYDGKPLSSSKYTAKGLLEGDYYSFEGLPSITHVWESPTDNEPTGAKIFTSEDVDVTSNYNITKITKGKLEITKRNLTLRSCSLEKTFDGKAFEKSDKYDIINGTSLAEGDRIEVQSMRSYDNTYVHCVDTTNDFEVKIFNESDEDVTEDYDIKYNKGTIKIKQCELSLGLFSTSFLYDGLEHSVAFDEADLSAGSDKIYLSKGTIPAGMHLAVSVSSDAFIRPTTMGVHLDSFVITTDPGLEANEDDFHLTFEGQFSINSRPLTLETISGSKIYDETSFGEELSDEDFLWIAYGSLAPGDYIASFDRMEMIEIGTYDNSVSNLVIRNALGEDVTDCYNISTELGKVIIYEM